MVIQQRKNAVLTMIDILIVLWAVVVVGVGVGVVVVVEVVVVVAVVICSTGSGPRALRLRRGALNPLQDLAYSGR